MLSEHSTLGTSHHRALAAGRGLVRVLLLLDLADEEFECLRNVLIVPRAGLGPRALVLLGQLLAVLCRDLALLGAQVTFVADYDDGYPLDSLHNEQDRSAPW